MSNPTHLHSRIRLYAIFMYYVTGVICLLLAYWIMHEPSSTEYGKWLLDQCLIVAMGGMAAYAFVKPLLVYHVLIDPNALTLSRMAGLQIVVIERKDIVLYAHEKGQSFGSLPYNVLNLYTSKARYVLDASDYLNFEQIKHEITKGVKRKY